MLVGLHCKCGKRLKVPETRIGKSGTCPNCHAGLRLVAPGFRPEVDRFDAHLEIVAGPDRLGEVIFLAGPGPIEIGRHPERHVVFAGHTVSRTHCRLLRSAGFSPADLSDSDPASPHPSLSASPRLRVPASYSAHPADLSAPEADTGWRIEDNKSTSGLYVNGRRIDAVTLHDGDKIRIGDYQLRFASEAAADHSPIAAFDNPPFFEAPPFPATDLEHDAQPASAGREETAEPSLVASLDDDNLYQLSDGDALDVAAAAEPTSVASLATQPTGGPVCPSCNKSLAPNAKICINCGIDLKTGRAIITSHAADLDTIYERTESVVWWLSWFIWLGIYPVASEAFGIRKPYFIRAVAILTVLTSIWFWRYDWADSPRMASVKNYMLWVGSGKPDPAMTFLRYQYTNYGDQNAFNASLDRLKAQREKAKDTGKPAPKAASATKAKPPQAVPTPPKPAAPNKTQGDVEGDDETESEDAETTDEDEAAAEEEDEEPWSEEDDEVEANLILAAHEALPPEKQCYGHYSPGQLITHAFLHSDLFHLAGNLLFLLVIGSRVNALVGNLPMIIIYPVLGVAAAIIYMASEQTSAPQAMLGASGAIMGLSGMYLVLMPVHNVHMAAWMRLGLITRFRLDFKIFPVRGFWMVLFYIAFDVFYTVLGVDDGVAHWAHLGGFFAGIGVGLLLLFTRLVNCRGGDIVSALLGKHAWAFIGKPDLNRKAPLEYGW